MLLPNELDEQISLSFNATYGSLSGVNETVDIKKNKNTTKTNRLECFKK